MRIYISNTIANFIFEIIKLSLTSFILYLAAELSYRNNSLNHILYIRAPLITKLINYKQYYNIKNKYTIIVIILSLFLFITSFIATILSTIWPVHFAVNYGGDSNIYSVNNTNGGISLVLNGINDIAEDGKIDITNLYCNNSKVCRSYGSTYEPDTTIINMVQTNVTPILNSSSNNSWGYITDFIDYFYVAGYPITTVNNSYENDGIYTVGTSNSNSPNYGFDLQCDMLAISSGDINYSSQSYNIDPLTSFAGFENTLDLSHTTHEIIIGDYISLLKINMDMSTSMLKANDFSNKISNKNWTNNFPACIKLQSSFNNISLNMNFDITNSKNYRVRHIYMKNLSLIKDDCMIYSNPANTMLITVRTEVNVYQGNANINNNDFKESGYVDITLGNTHKELSGKFNPYIPLAVEYIADYKQYMVWNPPANAIYSSIGNKLNSRTLGLSINNMACYLNSYDGFGIKGYKGNGLNGVHLDISLIIILIISIILGLISILLSLKWRMKSYTIPLEILIANSINKDISSLSFNNSFEYKITKTSDNIITINTEILTTKCLDESINESTKLN